MTILQKVEKALTVKWYSALDTLRDTKDHEDYCYYDGQCDAYREALRTIYSFMETDELIATLHTESEKV